MGNLCIFESSERISNRAVTTFASLVGVGVCAVCVNVNFICGEPARYGSTR